MIRFLTVLLCILLTCINMLAMLPFIILGFIFQFMLRAFQLGRFEGLGLYTGWIAKGLTPYTKKED